MIDPQDDWRAYFHAHGPAMLAFARQFTETREDAEDAVQEGFIRLWRHRHEAEDPKAYLYSCIRTAALDHARDRKRRRHRERCGGRPPQPALFVCPVEQRERRELVEQAIGELPQEQKEVLVLKIWSDLTFDQIARLYGISGNTAASRYRYALAALRERLDGEGHR